MARSVMHVFFMVRLIGAGFTLRRVHCSNSIAFCLTWWLTCEGFTVYMSCTSRVSISFDERIYFLLLVFVQSWLNGQSGPEGAAPPTIVFVAHHDAFAAVPVRHPTIV